MLFLSLVRGSGANQGATIFWQLIEMSGLLGGVYTELYRAVHRALFAIWNIRVSAFQGEVYTGRIGRIVGTLESVRIIEVFAFQGCPLFKGVRFSGVSARPGSTVVQSVLPWFVWLFRQLMHFCNIVQVIGEHVQYK